MTDKERNRQQAIAIMQQKGIKSAYFHTAVDHLVIYTGQAADLLDNYFQTYNDEWKGILWGGYVQGLEAEDTYMSVVISTVDTGVAFRKWRASNRIRKAYLEVIEIKLNNVVTPEMKKDFYTQLRERIPHNMTPNRFRTMTGAAARVQHIEILKNLTCWAEKITL